jgi:hypothetical protein
MSSGSVIPDLLRRFVAAPHLCNFFAGGTSVRLETNDPSIITALRSVTAFLSDENGKAPYYWKLIRDEAAPCGGRQVTILSSGPLNTLLLGTGTAIAIDRERREVLGFIAPDVPAEEFATRWLSLITRLLVTSESGASR